MAPTSRPAGRFTVAAQVAGVLGSAWLVWVYSVLPRLNRQSLASLLVESLVYVAMAWACGGIITFCVYMVVSLADLPDAVRVSLRASAPAMWYAPAFILLSVPAPAAFAVSVVLVVNATRLLVAQWVTAAPTSAEVTSLSRDWGVVLLSSFTAQAGMVAMLWPAPLAAAGLLATSAAILTSLAIVRGAYVPERTPALPPSVLGVAVTFLLAAALSVGGMAVRRGGGWSTEPGENSRTTAAPGGPPGSSLVTTTVAPPDESTEMGDGFPGVVLLPLVKPHTMIFVPAPATARALGLALTRPVGIPFSGEYWMFKPPRTRPPLRSVIRRGKPSEVAFHTTDGAALEMEAHQRLVQPMDARCCSEIQIAMSNTDHYPGTVALELILAQSEAAGGKWESLGTAPVSAGSSVEQTLSFRIPPGMAMHSFDEFKVVFHRDRLRADKSARIAIERFVMVP